MKKLFLLLFFFTIPALGQINDAPPNPYITQPIFNAIGMNMYNDPYNQNPRMWLIVDQVSPSLSACLSTNFSTCFTTGIRFRTGSILASTLTLTGTLTTPLGAGTVCVLSGGVLTTTGCTNVTTLNSFSNAVTIAGSGNISVTNASQTVTIGISGGFTGTKTAGTCVFTINNGLITNVTGC